MNTAQLVSTDTGFGDATLRSAVAAYLTCVIDAVLEHSPAEYVLRLHVSAESPLWG